MRPPSDGGLKTKTLFVTTTLVFLLENHDDIQMTGPLVLMEKRGFGTPNWGTFLWMAVGVVVVVVEIMI